ncbi:MAG: hypothetical protein U0P81_13190 [Holophagaceae bacterium]
MPSFRRAAALLLLPALPALAGGPLKVVTVAAPAINCVFNPSCTVMVTDSTSSLPVGNGAGFLQSRSYRGKAGAPGAGFWAVLYRVDLRNAVVAPRAPNGLVSLTVRTGPVAGGLDYNKDGSPDQVFVVTQGGLGTVGLASAVQDDAGNTTFTFASPVTAGTAPGLGKSSFFFGFASALPPAAASATVLDQGSTASTVAARAPMASAPDLNAWLTAHPAVAGAIKWQTAHQSPINVPPTDAMKVAWPSWTAAQKADLNQAYLDAFAWAAGGAAQVPMVPPGVSDKPQNLDPFLAVDTSPRLYLAQDAMWKLFTAHVGFSLFLELTQQVPWSLTAYDDASLRVLLDSSSMAWNVGPMGGTPAAYSFGLDPWHVPAQVADNLPQTAFAAPTWTFPFLRDAGCLGESRQESIAGVLDWMRHNMDHMLGGSSYAANEARWGYRGFPPISAIVAGTVDANNSQFGKLHWTAGCHGSVAFLCQTLRTLNIPVLPVWVQGPVLTSGHQAAWFLSENLYLDHGDDPYNQNVKASPSPVLGLLIDQATWTQRFVADPSLNPPYTASAWANVGKAAQDFQ